MTACYEWNNCHKSSQHSAGHCRTLQGTAGHCIMLRAYAPEGGLLRAMSDLEEITSRNYLAPVQKLTISDLTVT